MTAHYNPSLPLFSIHVPKCGGTSLAANLSHWFGDGLKFHYAQEESNSLPLRWALGPGTCVHGHFNRERSFGVLDYYPDAAQFVIFLRDPLEMHLSLYFYLKQHVRDYFRAGARYSITREFPDARAFIKRICEDKTHPFALSFQRYLPAAMTLDNFQDALSTSFIHIGITNDLDNSVALLARKLGKEYLKAGQLNTAKRDEDSDYQDLRMHHREHFGLDHAMYEYALEQHRYQLQDF